jgi:outer membrane protein OmpA-like peptidoglycan-associated protein
MRLKLSILLILTCPCLFGQDSLSILFDFDRAELKPAAKTQLDSFLATKNQMRSSLLFYIKGYCDSRGTTQYNNALSYRRAFMVKRHLIAKGFAAEAIVQVEGYGENEPLNENRDEAERRLNRRVIMRVATPVEAGNLRAKIADSTTRKGTQIVLHNINFVGGSHRFLPSSFPVLRELLDALRYYPNLAIEIQGHICCIPELDQDGVDIETGGENLSEERAKAVFDYLVNNGIDRSRLSFKGFGHSLPLYPYPEKSEEERIANRRVEIRITGK